jgi:hypothetical protein
MTTETDLKNTVQQAIRAEQLLNDELIQRFIVECRGDLLAKFESCKLDDDNERLAAWNQGQVLNMFLAKFTKKIKEGKNAKLTLLDRAKGAVRKII